MSEQEYTPGWYIVKNHRYFDMRLRLGDSWYAAGAGHTWTEPEEVLPGGPLDLKAIASGAGLEAELLEALQEISKGEGRYVRDPLEHADNCIEDMKSIARAALAKATRELKDDPVKAHGDDPYICPTCGFDCNDDPDLIVSTTEPRYNLGIDSRGWTENMRCPKCDGGWSVDAGT